MSRIKGTEMGVLSKRCKKI